MMKMPKDYEAWNGLAGMSNRGVSIDDGCEAALKSGKVFAVHSAWDFNGVFWWDAERKVFVEEVYRYHVHAGTHEAETLEELMRIVNEEHGSD
jgi:hypothetical protein